MPTCKFGMSPFTLDQMDLDSEEATKRPRPEEGFSTHPTTQGQGNRKKGKGKGKVPVPPPSWDHTNGSDEWDNPWPAQAMSQSHRYYIGETDYYQQHMRCNRNRPLPP